MKIEIRREITLTMTESEAEWLKDIMKNPLRFSKAEGESEWDKTHRKAFWNILEKEGF